MARLADPDPLPPQALLADDTIELRLIRVLTPADAVPHLPDAQWRWGAIQYCFGIHLRVDARSVGGIRLRVTDDQLILRALGHVGYDVDEPHRGNGYATRAIRLIVGVARHYGMVPLWMLIEPGNAASRKAAERAGLTFVDVIDTLPEAIELDPDLGPRLCRYRSA